MRAEQSVGQRRSSGGAEGEEQWAAAHPEQVVEIALVGDLAEVDAEEEGEEGLGVARHEAHEVLLFHGLGKDDDAARFNYSLGVLQGQALRSN